MTFCHSLPYCCLRLAGNLLWPIKFRPCGLYESVLESVSSVFRLLLCQTPNDVPSKTSPEANSFGRMTSNYDSAVKANFWSGTSCHFKGAFHCVLRQWLTYELSCHIMPPCGQRWYCYIVCFKQTKRKKQQRVVIFPSSVKNVTQVVFAAFNLSCKIWSICYAECCFPVVVFFTSLWSCKMNIVYKKYFVSRWHEMLKGKMQGKWSTNNTKL